MRKALMALATLVMAAVVGITGMNIGQVQPASAQAASSGKQAAKPAIIVPKRGATPKQVYLTLKKNKQSKGVKSSAAKYTKRVRKAMANDQTGWVKNRENCKAGGNFKLCIQQDYYLTKGKRTDQRLQVIWTNTSDKWFLDAYPSFSGYRLVSLEGNNQNESFGIPDYKRYEDGDGGFAIINLDPYAQTFFNLSQMYFQSAKIGPAVPGIIHMNLLYG